MSAIVITEPTVIKVTDGRRYAFSSDGGDAIIKEPRLDWKEADTSLWLEVHGSPVSDGAEAPIVTPMTRRIEISGASYPFTINLTPMRR